MKKLIFLDFDGVITTLKSRWCLDPEKIALLQEIVDKTGAEIVISSSWRRGTLESTIRSITDPNNPFVKDVPFSLLDKVVGITRRLQVIDPSGETSPRNIRGIEIMSYLQEHNYEDISYVILDDDSDMLYWQKDNFIQTDASEGLSKEDVQKAIKILNK